MSLKLILGVAGRRRFGIVQKQVFCAYQNYNGSASYPRFLHVKVFDKNVVDLDGQCENEIRDEQENTFVKAAVATTQTGHGGRSSINKEQGFQVADVGRHNSNKVRNFDFGEDADTFGDAKIYEDDAGDLIEEEYIQNPKRLSKQLRTIDYARLIKECLNANRLKDAIDVLEVRMIKEDGVKPENYIYNLLISGCAKAGYTRKAFSLFTKMRNRGLQVTGGTYTSLFNACANAPSPADGLARANHLREIVLEKGYELNAINYNAMIKAYGRGGDIKTAYLLVDEMMDKNLPIKTETFNFLLQACASDADLGFRHCLLTWHKMFKRNIRPDYYTFKLVLRIVRDCGFGDLQTMQDVLQEIMEERQTIDLQTLKQNDTEKQLVLEGNDSTGQAYTEAKQMIVQDNSNSLQLTNVTTQLEIPNLLAIRPHLGSLMKLSEVKQPHERFLLLGGLTGFLELMKENHVTPDIETFTTMLEVIPPTNTAEKQLLSFIRRIGLKADIDFFNMLMKKRSMRFDYESAREVLSMIRTAGLHPDIVTYGVLALSCKTRENSRELLQQMHHNGVRMNIQILGAMLRQGCAQKTFPYVIEILQISLDEHIKPNDIFLKHLHNFYNQCARAIDARHPSTKTAAYKKGHEKFCDKLRLYYEEHGIAGLKLEDAIRKIKERPYEQYKEADTKGIEHLKNERLAKTQKIRKYIKKIKINSLRDDDVIESKPKMLQKK